MDRPFEIPLNRFDKGRHTVPAVGSFMHSLNLSPFIRRDGKMRAITRMVNIANSGALTTLKGSTCILPVGSVVFQFNDSNGDTHYATPASDCSETYSKLRTASNGVVSSAVPAPDPTDLTKTNVYYFFSNGKIGRATPTLTDSANWNDNWKTSADVGTIDSSAPSRHSIVIRDWVLFCNGRYIGGWKFSTGSAESVNAQLLDFQPGYNTYKIIPRKASGVRLVYIAVKHATNRMLDGVGVWDLDKSTPIDFIPVPLLSDIEVDDQGRIWATHGANAEISLVTNDGPKPVTQLYDRPIFNSVSYLPVFLGKWKGLLLLSFVADPSLDAYESIGSSGLWTLDPSSGAVVQWLTPYNNDFRGVSVTAIAVGQAEQIYMGYSVTCGNTTYGIDRIVSPGTSFDENPLCHLMLPVFGDDSPKMKIWDQLEFMHEILSSSNARIDVFVRDFSRKLILFGPQVCTSSPTSTTLTRSSGWGNAAVGDAVVITAGTGSGQIRIITNKTATVLTVDRAFDVTPDTNSYVEVWAFTYLGSVKYADSDPNRAVIPIGKQATRFQPLLYIKCDGSNMIADLGIHAFRVRGRVLDAYGN